MQITAQRSSVAADDDWPILERVSEEISGGEVDTERAAKMLVGEFRASKWGRLSLERPPRREAAEEEADDAEDIEIDEQ